MALAHKMPVKSAPGSPGLSVTAMAPISLTLTPASYKERFITLSMFSTWCLAAISGTTPPNLACFAILEETIFDKISIPFLTTPAAVSSHEVSMPNINMLFPAVYNYPLQHIYCPQQLVVQFLSVLFLELFLLGLFFLLH